MSYSNNGFPGNSPPPSYRHAVAGSPPTATPPPSYEEFVNSQSSPTSVQQQGNANLQHLSRQGRGVPAGDQPAAGGEASSRGAARPSDFSASSDDAGEAGEAGEAGDEFGAPSIFSIRSRLRRQVSEAVHRATRTTSKVDRFDLAEAVYQRMDRVLVGDFKDARAAFKREVEMLERHLSRDPSDTAVADCRSRLTRCLRELDEVSHRLCERCLKPTRAFVEQALLRHRGSEHLTGHDRRLIAAAFEDLSLETVERDLAAAHATYAQLVPDAPRSNARDLQQLRRTYGHV